MVPFTWLEENFVLHPSRCLYWEKERTLVLSDLHLGKTGHFRKEGIAVPQQVYQEDLHRLFSAIQYFNPVEVLMVGDLFHSRANKEWEWFAKWRADFPALNFTLILGNHDKLPAGLADKIDITIQDSLVKNNILLLHNEEDWNPVENPGIRGKICGHIHPAVVVPVGARQKIRMPCFHFTSQTCTLPAFSLFTGGHPIKQGPKDLVFAIADGQIIKI